MRIYAKTWLYAILLPVYAAFFTTPVVAQDADQAEAKDSLLEEVVITGSRRANPRSATDSTVPIDPVGVENQLVFGGRYH